MPTIEDYRYDPKAREEGRQTMLALNPQHFVEVVRAHFSESEQATQEIRDEWTDNWRLYDSRANYSDKEEWQSQVWVPMPFSAVEQAIAIIQRTMLDSPEFFGIEGIDERDKLVADELLKPLLRIVFNKAKLVGKFTDAAKVGFICGVSMYLRFRYRYYPSAKLSGIQVDPQTGMPRPVYQRSGKRQLCIDLVEPWKIYRDKDSKPRQQYSGSFLIHREWLERSFLMSMQESGIYKNVNNLSGSANAQERVEEAKRKGQQDNRHKFRHPCECREWYGDMVNENGDVIYPDAQLIVAENQPIYGPVDNPLWAFDLETGRRKWPYIAFSPLTHSLRFEGNGILRTVTPLAMMFSNLFNMFSDGLNWSVNMPTELDTSLLDEWDDQEHYPGKIWFKHGQGQLLTPAKIGTMEAPTVLAALQYVNQMFENNSFVTSFVSGLPGSRSQITKGEVQIKTGQSMGIFEGMAKNMESGGTDAIALAHDFVIQYMTDFTDPELLQRLGPLAQSLAAMDPFTRMSELGGNFNYIFTGISAALAKSDQLGRLMQAATLAASGPYQGLTNPSDILKAVIDALGVRDKVTVTDVPMIRVDQAQAMVQQAVEGIMKGVGADTGPPKPPGENGGGGVPGFKKLSAPTDHQLRPTPNEMSSTVT